MPEMSQIAEEKKSLPAGTGQSCGSSPGRDFKIEGMNQLELTQAFLPSASEMIAPGDILEIAREIEEHDFAKAMKATVVPFPSRRAASGERGKQSVELDDWQLAKTGDYWERPSALGFESLRMMVDQTPLLNAVILTRMRQVQRFCRVSESSVDRPGFEIRHLDRTHQLSDSEQESLRYLNRFISHCGWEPSPRKRRKLGRDSFAQFMGKAVLDSLTMDSVGIETEWKRDERLGFDGFYLVDGGTIRLCPETGYRGDPDIYALQVVQGRISAAYTYADLIYEPRNPRSDVRFSGYGLPETEMLIKVVTGFLNSFNLNMRGFSDNSIPKGVLHLSGNYSQEDLAAFRRYWNAMVKGVNSSWTVPVLTSKDQESKASFERFGVDFDEMYFGKWMTFLASIVCAVYGMSPSEINFDSFTGGNTSALSGSDTAEKLSASKDSGLRPLLAYFENLISDYIISEYSDKYCFRWTGLDPADPEKRHEIRKLVLTVNELRAEEGYESLDGPLGDAPVNPSMIGPWLQLTQSQQPDFGPGQEEGGGQEQNPGEEPEESPEPEENQPEENPEEENLDEEPPEEPMKLRKALDFGTVIPDVIVIE